MGVSLAGLNLGLYSRYSMKVGGDDAMDRQDDDGHDFAAQFGGEIVAVYVEKRSAWKKKKIVLPDGRVIARVIRPEFTRMLADLRAGRIEGAVVYDLDRLTRDPRDLEDAIEVAELYGRPIVGPGVDLTNEYGRANARAQAVAANKASADTSRRQKRAHKSWAAQGIPVGGARPFGWQADKRTLLAAEADAVRQAVARIVDGVPLATIIRDWDTAGVLTPQGHRWTRTTLRRMLRNPRLCGIRSHQVEEPNARGEVTARMEPVYARDGSVVAGKWEPIVTVEQWRNLLTVVGDRAAPEGGRNARRYLFTGIARCGRCGHRLTGAPTYRKTPDGEPVASYIYRCPARSDGGCGGLSRQGPELEEHMLEAVFSKIELEMSAATAQPTPWTRGAELAEVQESITALNAAWRAVPRQVSPRNYFPAMDEFEARERDLIAERDAHNAHLAKIASLPADTRANWDTYTPAHQRSILEKQLLAVIVHPAGRGRRPFNPDLLEPVWQ